MSRAFIIRHPTERNCDLNGVKLDANGEARLDNAILAHAMQERECQVFDAATMKPAWPDEAEPAGDKQKIQTDSESGVANVKPERTQQHAKGT